jgi:hypothetical protein
MANKEWKLGILSASRTDSSVASLTRPAGFEPVEQGSPQRGDRQDACLPRQAGSLSSDFWNFIGQAQLLPLQLIGTLPFIHIKSWKAQIELPPMLRTPFADKYVIRSLLIRSR